MSHEISACQSESFLKFKKISADQRALFCDDVTPGAIFLHSFDQIEPFSSEFSQNYLVLK
jgi:hypothetical protein